MKATRNFKNPLITPADVKPSREDFKVDCTFNAGITRYKDEIIMLIRVAESVISDDENIIKIPLLEKKDGKYHLVIKTFDKIKDAEKYDFSDSRTIFAKTNNGEKVVKYLTSLSHFRIARSKDGVNFEVAEKPFMFPDGSYETWGIEDPRITKIDDTYYINYTAVSEKGAATALAKTKDFISYERLGIIFEPENKDVCIFPEKINGLYFALHRPVPKAIGTPDMWTAKSFDLIHWGQHHHFSAVTDDGWENGRIGGGAVPFKTEKGWIAIYHAADKNSRYCLGALLLDLEDPNKILAKTKMPILEPEAPYEKEGFFNNVVFTCGVLYENRVVKIYYGGADTVMALAEMSIEDLYKALGI
ncbi:glycosidase [Vulcanibacillus modesticaldus]|uniref:Glycosidase n=1 Tax=Vulcanibacillus modesticaldus TaxID=337097 RepID=A0A1D2YTY6_9BACI|nr:glycoside hydrolase family 130 protein [Vulcanibacillus modesticaldus]OEF99168.1 glycosidase [Vulcanibacillus modesticaldus]